MNINNNNGESIPVSFPKCRHDYCKTYLKFCHLLGYIGDDDADWYYCPKCFRMYLISSI